MPKSRNRKNHKQKLQARKNVIEQQKKKMEKAQRDFLMKLIERENNQGLFQNNPSFDTLNTSPEGPQITIEGPSI